MKSSAFSKLLSKSAAAPSSKTNFEEIYFEYHPKIKKQILYNMGDEQVDDVLQEVFFKIYKNLSKFENRSSLNTWIYKITLNTCYDFMRSKKSWFSFFSPNDISSIKDSQASTVETPDVKIDLQQAILKLKPELRKTFSLFYLSNLSVLEISKILEIPEGSVKSRLNSARTKIKLHFKLEDS